MNRRLKAKDLKANMVIDIMEDADFVPPEAEKILNWDFGKITEVGGWHDRYCPPNHTTICVENVGPLYIPSEEVFFVVNFNAEEDK